MSLKEELSAEMAELKANDRFRELRSIEPLPRSRARFGGKTFVNFSGNDYMGIACDPALRAEFYARYPDLSTPELAQSAASSRLLTGNTPAYERLEGILSEMYGGKRSALVFNCGYHANTGIIPALSGPKDLVLADKLDHASIIDGLKLSDAEFRRYRHLDTEHLEKLLEELRPKYRRVFLVTESVFSMDGDYPDLKRIVELKKKYDAILVVDEAHAVGVRGPKGAGMCAELGIADDVDIIIGTFGKAFGSTGAFAILEPEARETLINRMRPFIFTTGLPPVLLNWSSFVLEKCALMDVERARLKRMGIRLRECFGVNDGFDTQIVPLTAGEDSAAVALAEKFRNGGALVFAIRPPTVPKGTSRLRFSLSAGMDESDVEALGKLL